MKNNVIYINFAYQHRKKRFKTFIENLFKGRLIKKHKGDKKNQITKSEIYEFKHIL